MIYHYHAFYQCSDKSSDIVHIDGILTTEAPINNFERYKEIKKVIEPIHYQLLVISSLSLLDSSSNEEVNQPPGD